MDDSTPPTSSTKYTSAFTVTSGKTVKAVAEDADGATSSVVSKTYDSGGGGTWVNNTYTWGKGGIASIVITEKRFATLFKNETCIFPSKTKCDLKSNLSAKKQHLKRQKLAQKAA